MQTLSCTLRELLRTYGLMLCSEHKLNTGYGGEAVLLGEEEEAALNKIANEVLERQRGGFTNA